MAQLKFLLIIIMGSFFILSPLNAQENNSILCSDGIDNDGDGLIDCDDGECFNLPGNGCLICSDGISFADTLLEYSPGCPHFDLEPEGALGVSDWTGSVPDEPQFVFLGQGGSIKVGFTNNILTNSGDSQIDFKVFEIGPAVEPCYIALRPADLYTENQFIKLQISDFNQDGYYGIGKIGGSVAGIDIDNILPGYKEGILKFNAIEIKDIDDNPCHYGTPGADIDAICALFSIASDCQGIVGGDAVFDKCGKCLDPQDLKFNKSCIDCAGIINGVSIVDTCGVCLKPLDPFFNQSCVVDHTVFIPAAFSPDENNINDLFEVFASTGVVKKILSYEIFSLTGGVIYKKSNFDIFSTFNYWDGKYRGERVAPGIYYYKIQVEFSDGVIITYVDNVLLIR